RAARDTLRQHAGPAFPRTVQATYIGGAEPIAKFLVAPTSDHEDSLGRAGFADGCFQRAAGWAFAHDIRFQRGMLLPQGCYGGNEALVALNRKKRANRNYDLRRFWQTQFLARGASILWTEAGGIHAIGNDADFWRRRSEP